MNYHVVKEAVMACHKQCFHNLSGRFEDQDKSPE